jgi:hypothetical protein
VFYENGRKITSDDSRGSIDMNGLNILCITGGTVGVLTGIGALLIAIFYRYTKPQKREQIRTEPLSQAWHEDELYKLGQTCRQQTKR